LGTAYVPTLKKLTATSFITDISYSRKAWFFTSSIAADNGQLLGNQWGFSLSVARQGFLEMKRKK